jgi:D-3-phosphoglycerate dehydrogenase
MMRRMKILIADKFEQIGLDQLAERGCEIVFEPSLAADTLPGALAEHDPDVLVVRSTKVQAAAIDAAKMLKLIVRAGAGYDTIDVAKASTEGIFVANCPGKNAIAVAEIAWALILSCDRRVPDQTRDLRASEWNKKEYGKARGLYGRTLGVLGLGTIAREVVTRAQAFGMNVVAWSRSLTDERAAELGITRAATPIDVAVQSDVVSVHVASTPDTKNLIDARFVDAMKTGAYLINTSRGAVVDEAALRKGIADKGIRAGFDVYQGEPGKAQAEFFNPIVKDPGVYGTHHVGASTDQAQQAIAAEAVRVIATYDATGEVLNCVNRARKSPATCTLTVRHRNRPGVLATVFDALSEQRINVEEMENIIYEGAEAACARIRLDSGLDADRMSAIREACSDILSLELSSLQSNSGV